MRLMFQGTGSSVGKSTLVAGLARLLTNRGLSVLPFKPQNMSNNAAVTADGGEIGRAQWLQARACRAAPHTDMNPVLLKPQSEGLAQLVVHGRVRGANSARAYQALKPTLLPEILASFARLAARADIVLVEGAGSAAETNLRANDIANMGFARASETPVVVIGDIDRGGVIASLVGTHAVLDAPDRALVRGFVVNRMRGDATLFDAGMREIASRTNWEPLGLVPHTDTVRALPAEDSQDLARTNVSPRTSALKIAVPILPHISNFDDLDPLAADPACALRLLRPGTPLPPDTDLVILPGSKSVIADLRALTAEGWHHDIHAHHRRGGRTLGICGGLQILGRRISDPDGIEGPPETVPGLALLDLETTLTPDKTLREVTGTTHPDGRPVAGYEMHLGRTTGPDTSRPFALLDDATHDGATSPDGRIRGTYMHGIFAQPAQREALFGTDLARSHHDATVDIALDGLADHLERHLAIDRLLALAAAE